MSETNEQARRPEGIPAYDDLLEAAEALGRMQVVVCPVESCRRSATIERQQDGSTITRYHAEGQLDAVTKLLGQVTRQVRFDIYGHQEMLSVEPVSSRLCPEHSDYYEKLLEAEGVVRGPDDHRSAQQVYEDRQNRYITPF